MNYSKQQKKSKQRAYQKMNARLIMCLAILNVLQSCATYRSIEEYTVDELILASNYSKSEFDKTGTVTSTSWLESTDNYMTGQRNENYVWLIRSFLFNGEISHQLYIDIKYFGGDWRFYEDISLRGGEILESRNLLGKVLSCGASSYCEFNEILTIDVPKIYFDQSLIDGLNFRLNSKYLEHTWEYTIPKNFFIAQDIASEKLIEI